MGQVYSLARFFTLEVNMGSIIHQRQAGEFPGLLILNGGRYHMFFCLSDHGRKKLKHRGEILIRIEQIVLMLRALDESEGYLIFTEQLA